MHGGKRGQRGGRRVTLSCIPLIPAGGKMAEGNSNTRHIACWWPRTRTPGRSTAMVSVGGAASRTNLYRVVPHHCQQKPQEMVPLASLVYRPGRGHGWVVARGGPRLVGQGGSRGSRGATGAHREAPCWRSRARTPIGIVGDGTTVPSVSTYGSTYSSDTLGDP